MSTPEPVAAAPARKTGLVRRLVPLAILVLGLVGFFALDLNAYFTLEALRDHRGALQVIVVDNGLLAAVGFAVLYSVVVAFSLPGAAVMTVAAGFLFGTSGGGLIAVVGATIGATALFLIARTAVGDLLRARAGPFLARMEEGFRENAMSYLLFLRLTPVFPFWLVNLVPAFLGISTLTYVIGTFIGIIPAAFVFASVGDGLGAALDAGQDAHLGIIFKPKILGPLIALALISLLPIAYKKYQARKKAGSGS